jgi:VanZ family protein
MLLQKIARVAAWLCLLAIVTLTVVPPAMRPETEVPHDVEHAVAFLVAGVLFGVAYGHEFIVSITAVVFCAAIEITQLYVPGRHARVIDFVVDATAAVVGVFLGALARRTYLERQRTRSGA